MMERTRKKYCSWEIYGRCGSAACVHRDAPCVRSATCPQRTETETHVLYADGETEGAATTAPEE
jgi:hypothetical protein